MNRQIPVSFVNNVLYLQVVPVQCYWKVFLWFHRCRGQCLTSTTFAFVGEDQDNDGGRQGKFIFLLFNFTIDKTWDVNHLIYIMSLFCNL